MNLVFGMDGVICTPCKDYRDVERAKPLTNVREFMGWLQNYNEYIINKWAEKSSKVEDDEDFDMQLNDIIDIEEDEVA